MITTLTFKQFKKEIENKYEFNKGIVGIMLIKPSTMADAENNLFVVDNYEEWDSFTAYNPNPLYICWAGYGCWLNPSDENDRKIILNAYDNRTNRRIYFDKNKFGRFKSDLRVYWDDPHVKWGNNANLLLLDCNYGEIDFNTGRMITLDDFQAYGMRSRTELCEWLLRNCFVFDNTKDLLLELKKNIKSVVENTLQKTSNITMVLPHVTEITNYNETGSTVNYLFYSNATKCIEEVDEKIETKNLFLSNIQIEKYTQLKTAINEKAEPSTILKLGRECLNVLEGVASGIIANWLCQTIGIC